MSMQFRLSVRDNIPASTRRKILHDVDALHDEGLTLMTPHQVAHLKPALAGMLGPRAAVVRQEVR